MVVLDYKIPVLFAARLSVYKAYPFCDVYDEERDARTYTGSLPVIAHPPCQQWSRMRGFSIKDELQKNHGPWAVDLVRKNGGILEHPADSSLWNYMNMGKLTPDLYGGITLSINQHWFGFPAQKRTWLYIVGLERKDIPSHLLCFDAPQKTVDRLNYYKRSETTFQMAEYLFKIYDMLYTNLIKTGLSSK